MSLRNASGSRTMIWKRRFALEHQAGRAPADGYADRILHVRKAQTAARDLALVDLDL